VLEESVEVGGEVALETAGGLAAALSFSDSTLDVVMATRPLSATEA
jgi:hypothetical protein